MEVTTLLIYLVTIQLSTICPPAAAAAMSRPMASQLETRQAPACGGDSSLQQCGAPFPSDFCCPASSECLQLDSTAMSVLCCPAGQDCKFVSPISCDQNTQNATLLPGNQLHSDPTTPLDRCGESCCPPGATCHSGVCAIQAVTTTSSLTTAPTSSISSTSSPSASATGHITESSPPAAVSTSPNSLDEIDITDTAERLAKEFSGKSFVAGLFPGIVIGALAVVLLMWCLNRRRRRHHNHNDHTDYNDKKHFSAADQLTSLTPDPYRRPMHMRSISEPVSDPTNGHRTDFVRGTPSPPRAVNPLNHDPLNHNAGSYTATATGPLTPACTPKIRALFTRSTAFQSPPTPQPSHFPSHLKRGTLAHAYTVSPIRALRAKKSSHSLRRQMAADAAAAPAPLNTRARHLPTTNSTETIKVLMPRIELEASSPDQRNQQHRTPPPENPSSTRPNPTTHNSQSQPQPFSSWTWTTTTTTNSPTPLRLQPSSTSYNYNETPTRVPASQARNATRALGAAPFYSPLSNSPPSNSNPLSSQSQLQAGMVGGEGGGEEVGRVGGSQSQSQAQGGLSVPAANDGNNNNNNNKRELDDDDRRQTTFSGFMERAGIRPSAY